MDVPRCGGWLASVVWTIVGSFGSIAVGGRAAAASEKPPNIVVIMTDDLSVDVFEKLLDGGWLPNLESQLIQRGVRFDRSYVTSPSCCPSRATFLRGQYAHNHRIFSNHSIAGLTPGIASPGWFPAGDTPGREESTIATCLQDAGYVTGFIGKYLNGYGQFAPEGVADPATYVPPGWHDWQALIDPTTYRVFDYLVNDNGTIVAYGDVEADYQTDVLAERAASFIQERARAQRPFFLWLNTLAPHVEVHDVDELLEGGGSSFQFTIRPAPRHASLVDGDPSNGELPSWRPGRSYNEADMSDKPSCAIPVPPDGIVYNEDPFCIGDHSLLAMTAPSLLNGQYKSMLASMLAVDDLVGTVMHALDDIGVTDNTVIVFTSDNGWMYGEHRLTGKSAPYDESIRVPLVIRTPQGPAGTSDGIVLNNDLAPTIADLAGATPPYDMDGMSVVPLLRAPNFGWPRRLFLLEQWFIPSLVKFEIPTYFGIRFRTARRDFLYVATYADRDDLNRVTFREYYQCDRDPFQLQATQPPPSSLDTLLLFLRLSAGFQCRVLESL